jgi:putative acetyltransferase
MKIIIRKAKKGDGKGIAESFNEGLKRGFNAYTGNNQLMDRKKINKMEKQFKENSTHEFSYVAIDKDTGKIIGSAVLFGKNKGRVKHRAEVGWGVHPDYAGRGIATKMTSALIKEAKHLGFKRLEAEAAVKNIASVKLAKKLGFKIEGRKKCGLLLDNSKCVDTYMFGKILR